MSHKAVYDYLTPLEAAIAAIFTDAGLSTITASAVIDLQKPRPRVEIMASLGAAQAKFLPVSGVRGKSGIAREQARKIAIRFDALTDANTDVHRAYVAEILYQLDAIVPQLNTAGVLPSHFVQMLAVTGTSEIYKPQDGIYHTTINAEADISVRPEAWATLETTP